MNIMDLKVSIMLKNKSIAYPVVHAHTDITHLNNDVLVPFWRHTG